MQLLQRPRSSGGGGRVFSTAVQAGLTALVTVALCSGSDRGRFVSLLLRPGNGVSAFDSSSGGVFRAQQQQQQHLPLRNRTPQLQSHPHRRWLMQDAFGGDSSSRIVSNARRKAVTRTMVAANKGEDTNSPNDLDTRNELTTTTTDLVTSLSDSSVAAQELTDTEAAAAASSSSSAVASTGTVNERLMAELQQAAVQEKFGPQSKLGDRLKQFSSFQSSKTPEERQAAIEEAQNLNGVNPLVTMVGGIFALACAAALWYLTNTLATYFALRPVDELGGEVYFVTRVTLVFRNIVMGFFALASGFFGVTGLGIVLLALRVTLGIATGELDPTPLVPPPTTSSTPDESETTPATTNNKNGIDLGSAWDLMLNKSSKRGRR